jgi:hypothetical protein
MHLKESRDPKLLLWAYTHVLGMLREQNRGVAGVGRGTLIMIGIKPDSTAGRGRRSARKYAVEGDLFTDALDRRPLCIRTVNPKIWPSDG